MKAVKRFIIPMLLVAGTAAAIAATPRLRSMFFASPITEKFKTTPSAYQKIYNEEEEALFTELAGLYNRVGAMNAYLAEGSIRLTDQADSSKSLYTRFRYCHKDSMTYYELGEQEILSIPGLSLTINHEVKKMFMSPRDPDVRSMRMLVDDNQLKTLKEEGYDIVKENSEPLTVIRLKKEKHISCREYRVAYDSAGFIRRIFIRNADEYMPTDLSRDKLISININKWQTERLPEQLLNVFRYIQRDGETWLPSSGFKNYEIRYIY